MPKDYSIEVDNHIRAYGETYSDGRIKINVAKGDVVNTVIHEKLHADNPGMNEKQV